jgi:hypothetical protein
VNRESETMTNRIRIYAAAIILLAGLAGASIAADPPAPAAPAFDLVTESEAAKWNGTAPPPSSEFRGREFNADDASPNCRSTADNEAENPRIRVLAPTLEKPLIAPIDIDLEFIRAGSAQIRPETLRVCYVGAVTMDITRRITDRGTVTEHGLHVSGVQLPHGRHHLVLIIADERGRLARRDAEFNVL